MSNTTDRDELRAEIAETRAEMAETAAALAAKADVKARVKQSTAERTAKVTQAAAETKDRVTEKAHELADKVVETAHDARDKITSKREEGQEPPRDPFIEGLPVEEPQRRPAPTALIAGAALAIAATITAVIIRRRR